MSTERSAEHDAEHDAGQAGEAGTDTGPAAESAGSTETRPLPPRRVWLLALAALFVLALDVITKVVVTATLEVDQQAGATPPELLGGLVHLSVLRNPGAAWGMASGMTVVLAVVGLAVVGFIIWMAPRLRSVGWALGLGLILGGAMGNLSDRLFRAPAPLQGHVVDFISVFSPYGHTFPVFNVADSGLTVGCLLIVLMALLQRDYDGTSAKDRKTGDATKGGATA